MFATVGALHVACNWIHGEGEGEGEGEGAGVDVHNMRLNTAHCALVLYGVYIGIATLYADATHSGSCKTAAATRTRTKFIWECTGTQQAGGQRGGGASFGRADAAQVCNDVGIFLVDRVFECSATATRQIVSERWRERRGLKHLSLAATSAFDSTKRRATSRVPNMAALCSGVDRLKESKRMNLRKQSIAS